MQLTQELTRDISLAPFVTEVESRQYITFSGSRLVPEDLKSLQTKIGTLFTDLGFTGRCNLEPGSETNFYNGAKLSERFNEVGFISYLQDNNVVTTAEYGYREPDASREIFNCQQLQVAFSRIQRALSMSVDFSLRRRLSTTPEYFVAKLMALLGVEPNYSGKSKGLITYRPLDLYEMDKKNIPQTLLAINLQELYAAFNGIPILNLADESDRNRIQTCIMNRTSPFTKG